MSENVSPDIKEFRDFCRSELQFLLDDFGFRELPRRTGKFVNDYEVRFGNDAVEVVIEGINYGFAATVSIARRNDPEKRIPVHFLVPHSESLPSLAEDLASSQLRDIRRGSAIIKTWGREALAGDFGLAEDRYDSIVRAWAPPTAEQREERQFQSAVASAGHSFKQGDHARVVELLAPYENKLSPYQAKLLELARDRVE